MNNLKTITAAEAVNAIRKTRGGFFGVTFIKRDGTTRRMLARTGAHRKTTGGRSTVEGRTEYVTVWDRHAGGFRNINVNTITELTFNGQRCMVA
jgi:hypothetical protein